MESGRLRRIRGEETAKTYATCRLLYQCNVLALFIHLRSTIHNQATLYLLIVSIQKRAPQTEHIKLKEYLLWEPHRVLHVNTIAKQSVLHKFMQANTSYYQQISNQTFH
jgi:hypothetical protein